MLDKFRPISEMSGAELKALREKAEEEAEKRAEENDKRTEQEYQEELRQRTPEQLKRIEEERADFIKRLDVFREEALRQFERKGYTPGVVNLALGLAFNMRLDERPEDDMDI
jgi:hypothetical protein